MMKKSSRLILLAPLLCVLLMTACIMPKHAKEPDKGEKELKEYAQHECPSCTFVRYEEEKNKNTAYFTDDKCGFEFSVSCEVTGSTDDSGNIEIYYEDKTVNGWGPAYQSYLLDCIKDDFDRICKEYGMTYDKESYDPSTKNFLRLKSDRTYEQIKDGLVKLGDLIKQADVHKKYTKFEMRVAPATEDYSPFFAFYRFKDGMTGTDDDWQAYCFIDIAEQQLGMKCTYERTEQMRTHDIPGITELQVFSSESTENIIKKVYYFTTEKGEKKFITDFFEKPDTYYIGDVK